jgi:crotonobetainyl-CoA:carnitine CoA-transferase CaiB-like acyl-CoA transferase
MAAAGPRPVSDLPGGQPQQAQPAVDLKTAEGRQIVQTLAAKSDVVLQGFGSGAAARLGVDYKTLSGMNPSLICARFPDTEERGH